MPSLFLVLVRPGTELSAVYVGAPNLVAARSKTTIAFLVFNCRETNMMPSTFASSMNDSFVAAGMLSALCLALDSARPPPALSWALAGLVAGATAGLKLSAALYCVALAAAALPGGDAGDKARRLLALACGGLVGFALTYGWWGWRMAADFGNPVFPYFNQWFHSASAPGLAFADERFRPGSIAADLLAPIHLLRNSRLFSELTLRDPRLLCGLLAFAFLAWRGDGRRLVDAPEKTGAAEPARSSKLRAAAMFLVAGFAIWVLQYGIYRYAIVLEMLGTLGLVLALQRLPGRWIAPAALVLAFVFVSADTRRPHWGRKATVSVAGMQAPGLGGGAIVVTAVDAPLGYLALGLPATVPMLNLAGNFIQPGRCTRLQARVAALLSTHTGPVWLLSGGVPTRDSVSLLQREYGLDAAGACVDYPNPLAPARLCPLRRIGPARVTCPDQAR